MIKDTVFLKQFEQDLKRKEKPNYRKDIKMLDGMLEEIRYLKLLPLKNPLAGIETDIKIAKAINSV